MSDNTETLYCPACGKIMQKVFMSNQGCSLDVCSEGCGGILFDPNELKYFDEEHENIDELKEVLKDKIFEKVDESEIRVCPLCGSNMVKNFVSVKKQVQIDECYNCGAKFFDNGELEKMREEYATEQDRRQDFLSRNYGEVGAKIDSLEFNNNLNKNSRSVLLKLMDKIFLNRD